MLPLVCLDVDGTLVGSAGAPSDRLWAAADRARARRQHLTLCTARVALGPTREWAERLDPDGFHIFHTGATLWRPATGEVVAHPLTDQAVDAAARIAAERAWVFEVYTFDDWAVDSDAPLALAHADLLGLAHERRRIDSLDGPVVRVQWVIPISDLADALRLAPEGCTASGATSPAMPGAAFVSVTDATVSKAAGVTEVAGHLGVSMDAVMMVGDGHNDLSAMAVVGWPVAIGDADPDVVAAARIVVAAVDDDGAAEAIDKSEELTA
ncbi:MAG TPA: HAD family hydrolase [Acidimicrobiales bacterium]|nr:HAD family hydrolase [Acidimicrobiales bacterium]